MVRCVILVCNAEVAEGEGSTRKLAEEDAKSQLSVMDQKFIEAGMGTVEFHTDED